MESNCKERADHFIDNTLLLNVDKSSWVTRDGQAQGGSRGVASEAPASRKASHLLPIRTGGITVANKNTGCPIQFKYF